MPTMAAPKAATPVVRNNPGNLRPLPSGNWSGQTGTDGGFAVFGSPEAGQAAAEQNLIAKQTKHGLNTLNSIIGDPTYGWAPASDHNDPVAYAKKVGQAVGIDPAAPIDLAGNPALRQRVLQAMFSVEQGTPQPKAPNGDLGAVLGIGQPMPAGLTADEQKQWASLQPQAPTTPGGQTPAAPNAPVRGAEGQPLTAAQAKFYSDHQPVGGWDSSPGMEGTAAMPYALQPGSPLPTTPGAHYVDFDGVEHIVPGGLPEKIAGVVRGAFQGAIVDPAESANKLFGGGLAVGDPMAAAYGQTQGGPSAFDTAQGSLQGQRQQQHDYSVQNMGNEFAQGGRFAGQTATSTALTGLVPEVRLPGMAAKGVAGALSQGASKAVTNALRGVVATAPTVSTSDAPVGRQLATGAIAGAVVPPALEAAGGLGAKAAGLGASVEASPEVRALADTAVNKYNIPLRASQIGGADNPALAIKDSNLIGAPATGFAQNNRQQLTAFTKAVAGTFGADSDKITPQVMDGARKALGAQFDAFAKSHAIQDGAALSTRLDGVLADAQQVMPASELTPLQNQVANIKSLIKDGQISGDAYQRLVAKGSPLDRAIQAPDSNVRYYAQQIRDGLDDGIMASATPEQQAAFSKTRLQYKNLMTIKGLAAKAGVHGEISPVQLQGVVNRSFDDRAFSGAGDLGELADIGQTFMKQPPQSGTAPRIAEMASRNRIPLALSGIGAGSAVLAHPEAAVTALAGGALAKGASLGINALQGLKYGAGAGERLVNGPGAFGNALGFINRKTAPVQVPLSALGAHFAFSPPIGPLGSPVGAQPQEAH